jgi:hypothetical protein
MMIVILIVLCFGEPRFAAPAARASRNLNGQAN